MLRLALSTLAARKSGTFGALAAVGLAVIRFTRTREYQKTLVPCVSPTTVSRSNYCGRRQRGSGAEGAWSCRSERSTRARSTRS